MLLKLWQSCCHGLFPGEPVPVTYQSSEVLALFNVSIDGKSKHGKSNYILIRSFTVLNIATLSLSLLTVLRDASLPLSSCTNACILLEDYGIPNDYFNFLFNYIGCQYHCRYSWRLPFSVNMAEDWYVKKKFLVLEPQKHKFRTTVLFKCSLCFPFILWNMYTTTSVGVCIFFSLLGITLHEIVINLQFKFWSSWGIKCKNE